MEQEGSRRRGAPRSEAEVIFGTRVRRFRELTNMTQAQLADEMRRRGAPLDPTMVAKVERGTRPTNVAEVLAFRDAMRLDSVSRLFGEDDLSEREALLLRSRHAWARLRAHRDDLRRELAAVEAEAEELRKRDEALQGGSGGDDGEHPEAP